MNNDWFMDYAEHTIRAIDIEMHWLELRGWIAKNGRHICEKSIIWNNRPAMSGFFMPI